MDEHAVRIDMVVGVAADVVAPLREVHAMARVGKDACAGWRNADISSAVDNISLRSFIPVHAEVCAWICVQGYNLDIRYSL